MNIPSNRGEIVYMFFQHDITMCLNVSKHNVEIKMSSNIVLSCLQMVKESHVEAKYLSIKFWVCKKRVQSGQTLDNQGSDERRAVLCNGGSCWYFQLYAVQNVWCVVCM